ASWTALLLAMLVWLPVKRATTGSGLSPDQISPAYPGAPKAAKGAKVYLEISTLVNAHWIGPGY
ncbi:MAG: hypothetical protein AB7H86_23575, partial [Blastocatellales bacterium]